MAGQPEVGLAPTYLVYATGALEQERTHMELEAVGDEAAVLRRHEAILGHVHVGSLLGGKFGEPGAVHGRGKATDGKEWEEEEEADDYWGFHL